MKKIITALFFLTTATSLFAQSGRIRIYFAGFECYRETWDDILNTDGKGDEVFFTFNFILADRNGNVKRSYEKRTSVYGDATGPFSNRISAGTCVDLFNHNMGGIKGGDKYYCNDLISEYDVADGDVLTVIPVGWEHDPIADNSISFASTIKSAYTNIAQKLAPIAIGLNIATGNLAGLVIPMTALGISKIKAGGDQGELGRPGTRPIGMEKYGDFTPLAVPLKTSDLVNITRSNTGFGNGVIGTNYNEEAVNNLRDHGNYTILFKVEFTPDPVATPANTGNTQTGNTQTNNTKTTGGVKTINMPVGSSVAGTWTGTYGTGNNNGPNFYSFRLNADGTMQVVSNTGAVIANGTYIFSNNQLSGSYTYTSSGRFSFAATLQANGAFNGTWGSNSNTSGGGNWVMSKAAANAIGNIR
ncbi:hypothetical protein [Ferruginibacter sp.]